MNNLISTNFHLINLPPLLPITIAFISGIVLAFYAISHLILFSCAFIFFLSSLFLHFIYQQSTMLHNLWYMIIIACGIYLYHYTTTHHTIIHQHIHAIPCTITGTIVDKTINSTKHQKTTILTVALNAIITPNTQIITHDYIMLQCTDNAVALDVGDVATLYNVVCKKPKESSLALYQIKERIVGMSFCKTLQYDLIKRPTWSIRRWLFNTKMSIFSACEQKMSPLCFLFFSSLFLGNRTYVKQSMEIANEPFKRWGIYHLLSRSGMHLALFIVIWHLLFKTLPIPFLLKNILLLLLSILYYALSWTSAPFIRAFSLLCAQKICLTAKLSYHSMHYLLIICLAFLFYSPYFLFFIDFQLSFALTLALIWLAQLSSQFLSFEYHQKEPNH